MTPQSRENSRRVFPRGPCLSAGADFSNEKSGILMIGMSLPQPMKTGKRLLK
jgi:hypothetical protein